MLTRRAVLSLGGLTLFAHCAAWTQDRKRRPVFLSGVGPTLSLYQLDVAGAKLVKKGSLQFPANVQYVWPHPDQPVIYATTGPTPMPGAPPPTSDQFISAVKVDVDAGTMKLHGAHVAIASRANHLTLDKTGSYLLSSHPRPDSMVLVHKVNPDLSVGDRMPQMAELDFGLYSHQVLMTPTNKGVIQVARGSNAGQDSPGQPEDPGSLNIFRFENGKLLPSGKIAPNGGYGFGPRHLDFHPTLPWVYVSMERQNAMYVYRMRGDTLDATPVFQRNLLEHSEQVAWGQMAGPIHVHPNGRTLYCTNRGDSENHDNEGENSLVVFDVSAPDGEPKRIQTISSQGFHPRTFSLDPSGKVVIVGNLMARTVKAGSRTSIMPATLALYRVQPDGRLAFTRRYELDAAAEERQFWSGIVTV